MVSLWASHSDSELPTALSSRPKSPPQGALTKLRSSPSPFFYFIFPPWLLLPPFVKFFWLLFSSASLWVHEGTDFRFGPSSDSTIVLCGWKEVGKGGEVVGEKKLEKLEKEWNEKGKEGGGKEVEREKMEFHFRFWGCWWHDSPAIKLILLLPDSAFRSPSSCPVTCLGSRNSSNAVYQNWSTLGRIYYNLYPKFKFEPRHISRGKTIQHFILP